MHAEGQSSLPIHSLPLTMAAMSERLAAIGEAAFLLGARGPKPSPAEPKAKLKSRTLSAFERAAAGFHLLERERESRSLQDAAKDETMGSAELES